MTWRRGFCLEWETAVGRRGWGQPRRRWMDEVVETMGPPLQQLNKAAPNQGNKVFQKNS